MTGRLDGTPQGSERPGVRQGELRRVHTRPRSRHRFPLRSAGDSVAAGDFGNGVFHLHRGMLAAPNQGRASARPTTIIKHQRTPIFQDQKSWERRK